MDPVLNLRIAQGMRDSAKKMQKIEDDLNTALKLTTNDNTQGGKRKISLEIDFMKFVNHPNFLKRDLPQYSSVISYMADYHVPRVISNSGG